METSVASYYKYSSTYAYSTDADSDSGQEDAYQTQQAPHLHIQYMWGLSHNVCVFRPTF